MKKNKLAILTIDEIKQISGGGAGGATAGFFAGKFLTHLVAQGGILIVSAAAAAVTFNPAVGVAVGQLWSPLSHL